MMPKHVRWARFGVEVVLIDRAEQSDRPPGVRRGQGVRLPTCNHKHSPRVNTQRTIEARLLST
eukprot:COSAG02_NODE_422_length_22587_cov_10.209089_17_plen_63_part_00